MDLRAERHELRLDALVPAVHVLHPREADAVVLVVESERTRKKTARWARQQLEDAGAKLLGVVLNKRAQHIPAWLYERFFA